MKNYTIKYTAVILFILYCSIDLFPQIEKEIISSIELRNIGPAFMTGRISDIVKDPGKPSTWYVATASSNVWKTTNNGTTWKPIFDHYGSYSTGCITLDPQNSFVIWLGTGENQSQRSVGWGDGIYKSSDGGKTWTNMGLKNSEHIGKIHVDPRNSDVIIVAAQGPLWKEGGDRGIFRSSDGGKTWNQTLEISPNTGAADLAVDPNNPDVMYASTYQRRRHVGILVAGGPESRIYKSSDNGKTWSLTNKGLPRGNLGRIALAVSPQKTNVVYAHISGEEQTSGFYRSEDHGMSWKKTSDYSIVDPQYYGEIYCDPHRYDHVYVMDVFIHYTIDGGENFERLNSRFKHVDNHSLLFDPEDEDYLMVGCDGGIYESWDRGNTWKYHDNLPITQFYRVGIDNDLPFYHVYGGTQDNSTLYAPNRTLSRQGITNADWKLALGGDGFQARIDPDDPNTVYCQYQYAGIVRYDRSTGQRTELQPQVDQNEDPLRWHWDSPLIISPYNSKRLYYAAQKLFRSDDRGDTWTAISDDLSRGEDRNQREVMGKIWPPEAVWKNVFTSPYGTIVSLAESSIVEGLIVVGTDDGLIQVTEDAGANWRKINDFPGVPDKAYVADVITSNHDEQVLYAVFNNHKEGDFSPYVLKSSDLGRSWEQINTGMDLPHACWTIVEDHEDPNLLFAGTEFGLFASVDGGDHWWQMKKLPTIPVRDLEIQQRENDLVCATFGRGFWILDDYSFLRSMDDADSTESVLFSIEDSWFFVAKGDKGYSDKGVFGNNYYTAPNPPNGPVLNIYVHERVLTAKQKRKASEKTGIISYPGYESLKKEDWEEDPLLYVLVTNDQGNIVSKIPVPNKKGFHRIEMNLTTTIYSDDGKIKGTVPPVLSGTFTAQLFLTQNGETTILSDQQSFQLNYLQLSDEVPSDDYDSFRKRATRALVSVMSLRDEVKRKLEELSTQKDLAVLSGNSGAIEKIEEERIRLNELQYVIAGDQTRRKRFQYHHPGLLQRIRRIYNNLWDGKQITNTHRTGLTQAETELESIKSNLK